MKAHDHTEETQVTTFNEEEERARRESTLQYNAQITTGALRIGGPHESLLESHRLGSSKGVLSSAVLSSSVAVPSSTIHHLPNSIMDESPLVEQFPSGTQPSIVHSQAGNPQAGFNGQDRAIPVPRPLMESMGNNPAALAAVALVSNPAFIAAAQALARAESTGPVRTDNAASGSSSEQELGFFGDGDKSFKYHGKHHQYNASSNKKQAIPTGLATAQDVDSSSESDSEENAEQEDTREGLGRGDLEAEDEAKLGASLVQNARTPASFSASGSLPMHSSESFSASSPDNKASAGKFRRAGSVKLPPLESAPLGTLQSYVPQTPDSTTSKFSQERTVRYNERAGIETAAQLLATASTVEVAPDVRLSMNSVASDNSESMDSQALALSKSSAAALKQVQAASAAVVAAAMQVNTLPSPVLFIENQHSIGVVQPMPKKAVMLSPLEQLRLAKALEEAKETGTVSVASTSASNDISAGAAGDTSQHHKKKGASNRSGGMALSSKTKSSSSSARTPRALTALPGTEGHRAGSPGRLERRDTLDEIENHTMELMKLSANTSTSRSKWIIHPRGKFRQRWDWARLLVCFYFVIMLPCQMGFDFYPEIGSVWWVFERLLEVFMMAEIVITFLTALDLDGQIIREWRKIAKQYITHWFLLDFLTAIPLIVIVELTLGGLGDSSAMSTNPEAKISVENVDVEYFFIICRALRLARVFRMGSILKKKEKALSINIGSARVYWFSGMFVLLSHWLSCVFVHFARRDEARIETSEEGQPMITVSTADPPLSSGEIYVAGYYWATQTLTTVGFGDVTMFSSTGRMMSVVGMFISSAIYAWGVKNVAAFLGEYLNAKDRGLKDKLQRVGEYMEARYLPEYLKQEIRSYVYHRETGRQALLANENGILDELSALLRSKVAFAINDHFLKGMSYFAGSDPLFLMEIALSLKVRCYAPREEIVREGEVGDEMYFIFRGKVQVIQGISEKVLCVLEEQNYFGEVSVIRPSVARTATVRTLTFCELRVLSRKQIVRALRKFPVMNERIEQLARQFEQLHDDSKPAKGGKSKANTRMIDVNDNRRKTFIEQLAASLANYEVRQTWKHRNDPLLHHALEKKAKKSKNNQRKSDNAQNATIGLKIKRKTQRAKSKARNFLGGSMFPTSSDGKEGGTTENRGGDRDGNTSDNSEGSEHSDSPGNLRNTFETYYKLQTEKTAAKTKSTIASAVGAISALETITRAAKATERRHGFAVQMHIEDDPAMKSALPSKASDSSFSRALFNRKSSGLEAVGGHGARWMTVQAAHSVLDQRKTLLSIIAEKQELLAKELSTISAAVEERKAVMNALSIKVLGSTTPTVRKDRRRTSHILAKEIKLIEKNQQEQEEAEEEARRLEQAKTLTEALNGTQPLIL